MLRNNRIGRDSAGIAKGSKGAWSWAAPLFFAPLILTVALAACTANQQAPQSTAPLAPASEPTADASVETLAAALPAPPPAAERPPVIPASFARPKLVGLDRAAVLEALGKPRLSRREARAEVLTFTGGDCSLFVFLYDGPDEVPVVRHVEARARQGFALVPEGRCLDNVLGRKAATANPV